MRGCGSNCFLGTINEQRRGARVVAICGSPAVWPRERPSFFSAGRWKPRNGSRFLLTKKAAPFLVISSSRRGHPRLSYFSYVGFFLPDPVSRAASPFTARRARIVSRMAHVFYRIASFIYTSCYLLYFYKINTTASTLYIFYSILLYN